MDHSGLKERIMQLQTMGGSDIAKAFVGFDGYIDLIQKAVKFSNPDAKTFFHSLSEIGAHIAHAAGKSAQVELHTITKKLGGNAPIMANALACLGIPNYCSGTLGFPAVHDVFKSMHPLCRILSFDEPAFTNALEFDDGKLILSELSAFDHLDFKHIQQSQGEHYLDEALLSSQLIALVDWTNLPLGTILWDQLFDHLHQLQIKGSWFFFDLCDPSKKTAMEVKEVLQVINRYKAIGKTVLGLNENEAWKVYYAIQGVDPADVEGLSGSSGISLDEVTVYIFKALEVNAVLVHPVDRTILVTKEKTYSCTGTVVSHPKILTGGGDNLNAGFCFGLMHDFAWEECMLLGMATSGSYVKNGISPDINALLDFLEKE